MNMQKTENFNEILSTIQSSKQKSYAQVNATLVELYWSIGKHISAKVKQKSWVNILQLSKKIKKLSAVLTVLPWRHNRYGTLSNE